MKKYLFFIFAFCAATSFGLVKEKFASFAINDDGCLEMSGTAMAFQGWDKNWQNPVAMTTFKSAEGYPKIEKGKSYETLGDVVFNGTQKARYGQTFKFLDKYTCDVSVSFTPPSGANLRSCNLYLNLPHREFREGIFFDDKNIAMPETYEKLFRLGQKVSTCKIVGNKGTIYLIGNPLEVYIQDNRIFKTDTSSIRINLKKSDDGVYRASFTVKFYGHALDKINLSKLVNAETNAGNLPRGSVSFGGLAYMIPSDDKCIEIPAEAEVNIPLKAHTNQALYLLNAFESKQPLNGKVAEVVINTDKGKRVVEIDATQTNSFSNDALKSLWRTKPQGKDVRKLYSTVVKLGGNRTKSATLKNLTDSPWKIVAASACSQILPRNSTSSVLVTEDENYAPAEFSLEVEKGSALDISWLLDAPAGKYGFAKAFGNRVAFEKNPDADFKIFGNNLCSESNYPTRENAVRLADTFARTGYNSVRIHHFDRPLIDPKSDGGVALDKDRIDRLDYLVAQMKERGIYITLDLYISRGLVAGVLEPEFEPLIKGATGSGLDIKAMFYLSEKAMKNWEDFSRNLLTHVNPYTGLAWKDDPAIFSISLVNENTIQHTARGKAKPYFDKKFAEWLAANNLKDSIAENKFLYNRFLKDLYLKTFNRQKKFLRDLGVKSMLTDQNFWGGLALSLSQENYDIVDTHYYFGHPKFLENKWSMPAGVNNTTSLKSHYSGIDKGVQVIKDKPFYITEWNHVLNNDYAAEGAFLMGAYGAMQDWTGLYRFTYSHAEITFKPKPIAYFDTAQNPIAYLGERAAALFMLRKDVKKSKIVIPYLLSRDVLERPSKDVSDNMFENPKLLRYLCSVGRVETILYDKIGDVELPKNAKFAVASEQGWIDAMKDKRVYPAWGFSDSILVDALKDTDCNVADKIFKSSTKQLTLDMKKYMLSIITPKSEGFALPEGQKLKGKFADVECKKWRSVVLVASVDNRNLQASKRILILHLSAVKNSNMKFTDENMNVIQASGSLPLLVRRAEAKVSLNGSFEGYKLYALSSDGKRIGEEKMTFDADGGKTSMILNTMRGDIAVFAYELVKE